MSRKFVLALLLAAPLVAADKKPVTIDAMMAAFHGNRGSFGSYVWAPGGKQFCYRKGTRLMLYDAASKSERELLDFDALEKAAVKPPAEGQFGWQNRRVDHCGQILEIVVRSSLDRLRVPQLRSQPSDGEQRVIR